MRADPSLNWNLETSRGFPLVIRLETLLAHWRNRTETGGERREHGFETSYVVPLAVLCASEKPNILHECARAGRNHINDPCFDFDMASIYAIDHQGCRD